MNYKVIVLGTGEVGNKAMNTLEKGFYYVEQLDIDGQSKSSERFHLLRQFDFVLNAIDDGHFRDEVNIMCLQMSVRCIDCHERAWRSARQSISLEFLSQPSSGEHCIFWAKHLFNQLFLDKLLDTKDLKLAGILNRLLTEVNEYDWNGIELIENPLYDFETIFNKLFYRDIDQLVIKAINETDCLDMENPLPLPIEYNTKYDETNPCDISSEQIKWKTFDISRELKIWTEKECKEAFMSSAVFIKKEIKKQKGRRNSKLITRAIMEFLTAATNLRAANFHILEQVSYWETNFNLTVDLTETTLFHLPNEIFDKMFSFMDDETLLNVSRTCKHFQPHVQRAFDRMYSKELFTYYESMPLEKIQQKRAILHNFNPKFKNISIHFDEEYCDGEYVSEHWIFDALKENGWTIEKLNFFMHRHKDMTNLKEVFHIFPLIKDFELCCCSIEGVEWAFVHMPLLKRCYFLMENIDDKEVLSSFFETNSQIDDLIIEKDVINDDGVIVCANNHLPQLKTLKSTIVHSPEPIHFKSLEYLELVDYYDRISLSTPEDKIVSNLRAFHVGCKRIKEIKFQMYCEDPFRDDILSAYQLHKRLRILHLSAYNVQPMHLEELQRLLPYLKILTVNMLFEVTFSEEIRQLVVDNIPNFARMILKIKCLTKLILSIPGSIFDCTIYDIESQNLNDSKKMAELLNGILLANVDLSRPRI